MNSNIIRDVFGVFTFVWFPCYTLVHTFKELLIFLLCSYHWLCDGGKTQLNLNLYIVALEIAEVANLEGYLISYSLQGWR